jgi:hypothetical protein
MPTQADLRREAVEQHNQKLKQGNGAPELAPKLVGNLQIFGGCLALLVGLSLLAGWAYYSSDPSTYNHTMTLATAVNSATAGSFFPVVTATAPATAPAVATASAVALASPSVPIASIVPSLTALATEVAGNPVTKVDPWPAIASLIFLSVLTLPSLIKKF